MQLKGSTKVMACVDDEARKVKLPEVYYAEKLLWNMMSYVKIEEMEYELFYDGHKRYVVLRSDGWKGFGVEKGTNNVLMVKIVENEMRKAKYHVAMAPDEETSSPEPDLQSGSLLYFHLRFAHL